MSKHTIADLDLDGGVALCDVLDAAEDLRHGGGTLLLSRAGVCLGMEVVEWSVESSN